MRHGIWRVSQDGVFYGDYRSRHLALDAAGDLQRKLAASGRKTKLLNA